MSEPPKGSLPAHPHLHWLKNRAKEKLAALRAANPAAKLTEAQRAVAREYGFASWRALKAHVDRLTSQRGAAVPAPQPPDKDLVKSFADAINGDVEGVRKMLDEHPSLATAVIDGQTMLHHAAGQGRVDAIRLLVQRGVDVNARWASSLHTPLSWAVTCEQREACEALIEGGARVDLFCAAGTGRLNVTKACFDGAGRLLSGAATTGSTRRRADGTRILELSTDPVELMSDALYIACRNGHGEVAEYLMERGADPNFRAFMGATCFHWAHFGGGDPRIIAAMLAHGGDANVLDADRHFTPRAFGVMVAASWGWTSKLRRILAVDPSLANLMDGGTTALHVAAKEGHADAVKCLLLHGADPDQRDAEGRTARDLAAQGAHFETMVRLKAHSAGPSGVGADGNSVVRRYTDDARKVMARANREAERLNHEFIGTEHILLALAEEGSGLGADVLKALGVDLHRVRRDVEKLVKVGPDLVTAGKKPQTPRAKVAVEYAIDEARSLNHSDVGTEHLLLGLLREHEGVAAHVLTHWRLELNTVRKVVEARRPPEANAIHSGTPPLRLVIEGVPELAWGIDQETTFGGTMAAATATLPRKLDYAQVMGYTALAFRTRWHAGPPNRPFSGSAPIGEQVEERQLITDVLGLKLEVVWSYAKPGESRDALAVKLVASIQNNRPVICYVNPHFDCALLYGYEDGGKTFLVRDYYKHPTGDRHTVDQLGGFFVFLRDGAAPLDPHTALTRALSAAVKNWTRTDHPGFDDGGQYLYNHEAFTRWRMEIATLEDPAHTPWVPLHTSWWNFNCLADARMAAATFLRQQTDLLKTNEARAHLRRAADLYKQELGITGQAFARKDAFLGPWTKKTEADWTSEVRRREVDILTELEAIEQKAITEIERALQAEGAR